MIGSLGRRIRRAPTTAEPARPRIPGRRTSRLLALLFLAMAVVVFPETPAQAAEAAATGCTTQEWSVDIPGCVARLADVSAARANCLLAPTPDSPADGLGGWFASQPDADKASGRKGLYTDFGYAGYAYTTYDIGCQQTLMHPDYKFENTVANGEFLVSTAVLGASDSLRERAWDPSKMWGWADPLVGQATTAIFKQVFTVFGAITLVVIGLYLLWRSRQAHMSAAMTTAGWAILVMVVVTAVASWPTFSAHTADKALVASLTTVHQALGPQADLPITDECSRRQDPESCRELRPPALRASDNAVQTMLYRNWLRGLLGSADNATAIKYGPSLYQARTLSWQEAADLNRDPLQRSTVLAQKATQWEKVAEQIRIEDPAAYEYLTGVRGLERIGAGFIALISTVMFAMFDFTASLLVLLGFVVFRWAIIATPLIGTVGLLRPASAGFRTSRECGSCVTVQHRYIWQRSCHISIRGRPNHDYRFIAGLATGRTNWTVWHCRLGATSAVPSNCPAGRRKHSCRHSPGNEAARLLSKRRQGRFGKRRVNLYDGVETRRDTTRDADAALARRSGAAGLTRAAQTYTGTDGRWVVRTVR